MTLVPSPYPPIPPHLLLLFTTRGEDELQGVPLVREVRKKAEFCCWQARLVTIPFAYVAEVAEMADTSQETIQPGSIVIFSPEHAEAAQPTLKLFGN